ncbi:MAG: tetratricopeptide repeat protein [Chitinophagales bacterium]|nr:tetratricopeptide repeat protein [Chitinophagales bacterium]
MRDIKELYELLDASTSDAQTMHILFDIATFFLNTDEERTTAVANDLKELAEKLDSNLGRCYYHSTLGRQLFRKSRYEEASAEFQMALQLSLLTDDKLMQAMCYDSIGVVCNPLNQNELALEMAFKALALYEQIPGKASEWQKGVCYNNIGTCYKNLGLLEKAEEAYLLGLKVIEQTPNDRMKYNLMSNLGGLKIEHGQYDEALDYLLPAIEGFKMLKHKIGELHSLVYLAQCYFERGDDAAALIHYLSVLRELKSVEHKLTEINALQGMGNVYSKMQAYPEAIAQFEKALSIAVATAHHKEACKCYIYLAQAYKAMGNPPAATDALDRGIAFATEKNLLPDLETLKKERAEV